MPTASALAPGPANVTLEQARAWASPGAPDTSLRPDQVLVAAAPGTSPETLVDRASDGVPGAISVRTADEASKDAVGDLTGGQDVIAGALLAFVVLDVSVGVATTLSLSVIERSCSSVLLGATRCCRAARTPAAAAWGE